MGLAVAADRKVPLTFGGACVVASNFTCTYVETNYANPHALTGYFNGSATTTYNYNQIGNLASTTGAATSTFTWDYRNRMRQASTTSASSTYQYDHSVQRMRQTVGSTTTDYPNRFFSITSTVNGATTTATSTAYIWHGDTLVGYVEQLLINGTASGTPTTYYVLPDHLNSTSAILNSAGTAVQALDYYPYGAARISTGSGGNNKRKFIGEFADDASSLDYLNSRFYDPARGQFTSQDPTHLAIGDPARLRSATGYTQDYFLADPQLLNSYAYGRGNPIRYSDPNGNCPWCLPFLVGGGAGGFGLYATDVLNNRAEGLTGWGAYAPRSSWQEYNTAVIFGAGTGGAAAYKLAAGGVVSILGSGVQDKVAGREIDEIGAMVSGVVTTGTGGVFRGLAGSSPASGKSFSGLPSAIFKNEIRYVVSSEAFQSSVNAIAQSNSYLRQLSTSGRSGQGGSNTQSVLSSLSRALSALSSALSSIKTSK